MEKNEMITGVCEAFGTNGEGIVRVGGVTLFVPFLLPGERAKLKILKLKGKIGYAKAEEIFTPAEVRRRPRCPVFFKCGGCGLQHLRYGEQLKFKTELVRDALKKIGGLEVSVLPCERSEKEYGYRNKLQLPIGRQGRENVVGFYAERSHRIIGTECCPIHPDWAEALIRALHRFMETCGLDGYDEQRGEGLRHLVVREIGGKFLVTLVSTYREIKGIDFFLHLLDEIFPEYSLFLNYHPENTNVVFGEAFKLVKGREVYQGEENGISFEAGPVTFLQVNEGVRNKLYAKALSLVGEEETVIDCYAGGGLLTAMFARKCRRAYGIEIVPEASACADSLKERNALSEKMTNLCGRVEELLPKVLQEEKDAVIVLDPPRAGLERSVTALLRECGAKKILMISCDPATLARDLGLLCGTLLPDEEGKLVKRSGEGPYEVLFAQPFDMFPQTKHVETLVLLSHRDRLT